MTGLLLVYLGLAAVWDIVTRTIPIALSLTALLGSAILLLTGRPSVTRTLAWLLGGLLGALVAWVVAAPDGDWWAFAVVGALLGVELAVLAFGLQLAAWQILILTLGRRRSMIGWPFIPWLLVATLVVLGGRGVLGWLG